MYKLPFNVITFRIIMLINLLIMSLFYYLLLELRSEVSEIRNNVIVIAEMDLKKGE